MTNEAARSYRFGEILALFMAQPLTSIDDASKGFQDNLAKVAFTKLDSGVFQMQPARTIEDLHHQMGSQFRYYKQFVEMKGEINVLGQWTNKVLKTSDYKRGIVEAANLIAHWENGTEDHNIRSEWALLTPKRLNFNVTMSDRRGITFTPLTDAYAEYWQKVGKLLEVDKVIDPASEFKENVSLYNLPKSEDEDKAVQ